MANVQAFNPTQAATVQINVGASSARVALGPPATGGYRQVRIVNDGTATVWVTFGDSTVTAVTASGLPVRVTTGKPEIITIPPGVTHVAAIAAAATGIVYFTPGSGL